ncbi:MAG: hypothetical protein Q7T94_12945 [Rugosibacter sp.]|nr:hypothetical protein [Rugosibacter sp.]
MDDKKLIGFKSGMAVYISDALLAQKGEREVREKLGLIRRYPVKTDLSGNVVMVEGDSHEDAVQRYLSRTIKAPNVKVTGSPVLSASPRGLPGSTPDTNGEQHGNN